MNREEMLNNIFIQFDKSARQFCDDTQGVFCEISTEYKGVALPQNLKYRFAKIYYNSFIVKFTYVAHGMMSAVNSIVGCSICFDKTDDSIEIPLPLVTHYCDVDVASPMVIPSITNEEGMIQAFECIGDVIRQLLPKFADISYDPEYKESITAAYKDEIKHIFEIDDLEYVSYSEVNNYFILRFSTIVFINYINGNVEKAVAQLKKVKRVTGYEMRMLKLMTSGQRHNIPASSPLVTANTKQFNKNGTPKANFKEFGAIFLSWLVIAPVTSIFYVGLYFLLMWIQGLGSVCLLGPLYNFPIGILAGFITTISISYFTRFRFYKWLYKKDYEEYCEVDSIQNGNGSDRLMKGFTIFTLVLGFVACVLFTSWNLKFMPDEFVDNSKFFSLRGEHYSYEEIERVYYRPDRVNGFGEVLDYPSYVLELKNGKEIDLYEHGDISDYEGELLDFFREKGVKVDDADRS